MLFLRSMDGAARGEPFNRNVIFGIGEPGSGFARSGRFALVRIGLPRDIARAV